MFSKGNKDKKETKSTNNPQVSDFSLPNPPEIDNSNTISEESLLPLTNSKSEIEQPQIVKVVEKISGILSPYFIVIVGLYLYDNNFLFGSILILIGILSLLKVSYDDVMQWIEQIKNFFKGDENDNLLE